MDDATLTAALEGLLVVLDRGLDPAEAATAWQVPVSLVEAILNQLADGYAAANRGIALRETATGWRLFAAADVSDAVRQVAVVETSARLSVAALETLAVVAYRQPVSRSRIAAIRGVNVDGVMRTLTTRGLIDVVDRDSVTGAALYATTDAFLDAVGVRTLDDLPEVAPLLPDVDTIEALSSEGST